MSRFGCDLKNSELGKNSQVDGEIDLPIDTLLTVQEVAGILRLDVATIRQMAKRQEIPAIKIGKVWRFKKTEIRKWLNHDSPK